MKNFRFLISLILSAALLLGLTPHGAFAATVITDISIVNFAKPVEGMTAAEATAASVPAGAHYRITEWAWYCENDEDDMTADDVFKRNRKYSFGMTVVPDSGYTFNASTAATINGGTDLIDYDYTSYDSQNGCFYIWVLPDYPVPNGPSAMIDTVNVYIDEMPRPDIEVCVLDDPYVDGSAPYVIEEWFWRDEFAGRDLDEDDWFSEGRGYSLCVTLTAADGCEFSSSLEFLVNFGEELVSTQYSMVYDRFTAILWTVPIIAEEPYLGVELVTVNGYETPVIGKKVSEMPAWSVPEDAEYHLVSSNWYKPDGTAMSGSDTFEKNVQYSAGCVVELNEGFDFAPSVSVSIKAEIDFDRSYIDGNKLYIYTKPAKTYAGLISEIRITMNGTPDPGLTPEDLPEPTVPSGADYQVIEWMWYCDTDREELYEDDPFEAGKEYSLEIVLEPLHNYGYSVNTVVYFNGSTDTVDTQGSYISHNNLYCVWTLPVISGEVAEKQIITQVNLKNFTLPIVGQTAGENLGPVTVDENAPYTIDSIAWHRMEDGDYTVKASEAFKAGVTYYLSVTLQPKYGYYFDGDNLPTALLNGEGTYVDAPYSRVNHGLGEGTFSFFSVELTLEEQTVKYGDVNNDGKIDGKDLIRLRKHLVGVEVETGAGADCNGDGMINGKDLIRLRKYLLSEDASILGPQ